jgi:hypothetical protein
MKRALLLTLAVVCVSGLAYGQDAGTIDIFSDAGLTSCNVTAAAQFNVYIGHTNSSGATASAFRIDHPATLIFLGEIQAQGLKIGSSEDGVGLSYNTCLNGTFLILTVTYFDQGTPPCALMTILGDSTHPSGQVAIVDCDETAFRFDQGGQARVNPDGTCQCNVPVEETTWGGIKALY